MASSLPFSSLAIKLSLRCDNRRSLQVRGQSFGDEGRSSNIVDANLSVLRERIGVVKIKERLKRCCRCENGWNYAAGYDYKLKRSAELSKHLDLAALVGGTVSLTIFCCTLCLYLVSFLVHLNQ